MFICGPPVARDPILGFNSIGQDTNHDQEQLSDNYLVNYFLLMYAQFSEV